MRRGLTKDGRRRLREAALRNRPWTYATGPRTAAGKARSSGNATKSGEHTAESKAARRQARETVTACMDGLRFLGGLCDCMGRSSRLAALAATLSDESPRSLRRLDRAAARLDALADDTLAVLGRFRESAVRLVSR
ncbi:hypothetical protein RAS1_36310 [Phycisphaerae bacterium RAS1]|nr:hypothetical protein RAS1_36310 [Phycisphaerae bacterium RAS1]